MARLCFGTTLVLFFVVLISTTEPSTSIGLSIYSYFKLLNNSFLDDCNKCPPGWTAYHFVNEPKCFLAKKLLITQAESFCEQLNATIAYPKTEEENQSYREVFNMLNISDSVAIKSCHGMVTLEQGGLWNPFPKESLVNIVCEQKINRSASRVKRQATLTSTPKLLHTVRPCTLKNATLANIGTITYCLANFGTSLYSKAEDLCKVQNATLPVPRSPIENKGLMRALKVMGINPAYKIGPVILGITDSIKGKEIGISV